MQTLQGRTAAGLDWAPALTLTERRDLHRELPAGSPEPDCDPQDLVRRHQYWATAPVHETVEDLERRLALDGMTLADYAAVSRGAALPPDAAERWPWVAHLHAICRDWEALQALAGPAPRSDHPAREAMDAVLRPFCAALLRDLRADLDALRADDTHGALAGSDLAGQLTAGFEGRLRNFSFSPTVLELHVVRHEAGLADGETAEAGRILRDRLLGEGGPAFLGEYPVMARILAELSLQERRNAVELARRARDDHELLAERFGRGAALGRLVEVSPSRGDAHAGGRAVRALRFSSGLRVLYKPRSLAIDEFVATFLRWLNGKGIAATQRPVAAVDRGAYGWTEVVEARACTSPEDVERYYRRAGGLLAVSHLLSARDLHFENVIAEGAHPVAVDLEGFFQPPTPRQDQELYTGGCIELLESGLLPSGMGRVQGSVADFDGSGLAGSGGVLPVTAMRVSAPEEGLRVVKDQARLETQPNLPVLDGRRVPPRAHVDAIEEGFREVARAVRASAAELAGPGGLLEQAAGLPIRIFHRPTNLYGRVLVSSAHSDLLRDALDRERLLDALWEGDEAPAMYRAAFAHERRDLLACDVPVFTALSDSVEIRASNGEPLPGVVARRSGMAVSRERIAGLDDDRVDGYAWALRAGIAATARQGEHPRWPTLVSGPPGAEPVPADALRRRAADLAGLLARRAEQGPYGLTWAGLASVGNLGWSFGPVELDLYAGSPGIVLFLAYAGACTGEEAFTRRAREGLDAARRAWAERLSGDPAGAGLDAHLLGGGFGELGGTVFALAHLAALWERDDLAAEARALCDVVAHRLADVEENDLVAGVAGTLAVVLTLHEVRPDGTLLRLAERCGDLLAERAEPRGDGVAWRTGEGGGFLAGFAHGAAGIAAALARLARAAGQPRWSELAARAVAFEDTLYSAEHRNWRDVRGEGPGEGEAAAYPVFWCHGAPGVALGRATMLGAPGVDGDRVLRDLREAAATTAGARTHSTHCLCHGSFGCLLVLRRCATALGDGASRLVGPVLDTVDRHGLVCGVPDGVLTPGLMLGAAGVGHALLALAEPSVPLLLGLEGLPA